MANEQVLPQEFLDFCSLTYRHLRSIVPTENGRYIDDEAAIHYIQIGTTPLTSQEYFDQARNLLASNQGAQLYDRYNLLARDQGLELLAQFMEYNRYVFEENSRAPSSAAELESEIRRQAELYRGMFGEHVTAGDIHDLVLIGERRFLEAGAFFFSYGSLSGSLNQFEFIGGGDDYNVPSLMNIPYSPDLIKRVFFEKAYSRMLRSRFGGDFDPGNPQDTLSRARVEVEGISAKMLQEPGSASDRAERELAIHIASDYLDSLEKVDLHYFREGAINGERLKLDLFQLEGAARGLRDRRVINADEMGVGKTAEAILVDVNLRKQHGRGFKTLIIPPYQMKDEWARRYHKYLTEDARTELGLEGRISIVNSSKELKQNLKEDNAVLIVNYELVNRSQRLLYQLLETTMEEDDLADDSYIERVKSLQKELLEKFSEESKDDLLKRCNSILFIAHGTEGKRQFSRWKDQYNPSKEQAAELLARLEVEGEEHSTLRWIKRWGPDNLIVDEAHAAKQATTIRSQGIVELGLQTEYIMLLTGTLIPNRVNDVLTPLKMVCGEWNSAEHRFQPRSELERSLYYLFPSPREARLALLPYFIRRTREEVAPRDYSVRIHEPIRVRADPLTLATYLEVLDDDTSNFNRKLLLARRASVNPVIVAREVLGPEMLEDLGIDGDYVPPKYRALAELIEPLLEAGRKVVVYNYNVDGITSHTRTDPQHRLISGFLNDRFGDVAVAHDGNTDDRDREQRLTLFRGCDRYGNPVPLDQQKQVLNASVGTISEGVDLSPATVIVHLQDSFNSQSQPNCRVDRRTQRNDVDIYTILMVDPLLQNEARNGRTIDESVSVLISDKELVSRVILDGAPIGDLELAAYERLRNLRSDNPSTHQGIRDTLVRNNVVSFLRRVSNRGGQSNLQNWEARYFSEYIELILRETFHARRVNQAAAQLIEGLPDEIGILDLGGGPASLSLSSERPTHVYDMLNWEDALRSYGGLDDLLGRNDFRRGFIDDLSPYSDEGFDFASFIYSLHWTETRRHSKQYSEREMALREVHRVLRPNGYMLVALPHSQYRGRSVPARISQTFEHLGFTPRYVGGVSERGTSFKTFFGLAQKTHQPLEEAVRKQTLDFRTSQGRLGRQKSGRTRRPREERPTNIFVDRNNNPIGGLINPGG